MNPHKILIVGGGIAGTTLALHLIDLGAKVTLIDKGENHSTSIAAGMVNPIVFRRMNLSWEVQKNFPLAVDFFKNLEIKINQKLIFPIKIRRLFSSKEERELWSERAQTNDFKDFLNPITKDDINYDSNLNKFGTGRVNAFWVDSKKYYEHSHKLINTNAQLLYHIFDSDNLNLTDVSYNSEIYDSIVFCLGYENNRIELFKEIPIQTTKGQLLTIASEKIPQTESLNRKCFLIPKGNKHFIAGATYEWNNTSLNIDDKGLSELTKKLTYVTDSKYEFVKQEAGIRPTMLDRRPVLGEHPKYSKIYVFNGLGTKGYLLAPGLSKEMVNHVLHGTKIPDEYSISRFYS